jgi:hypothetical protein
MTKWSGWPIPSTTATIPKPRGADQGFGPQARACSAAEGAGRVARARGAAQEHPARPHHARTRRWPTSPRIRPRPAGRSRQGARPFAWLADNEIGARLMNTLAAAEPLLPMTNAAASGPRGPLGKEGALVADLLKLLLKIRCREIDVAARLLARSDELEALAAGASKGLALQGIWLRRAGIGGRKARLRRREWQTAHGADSAGKRVAR